MVILQTEQLKKYYETGDVVVKALDGVDLTVEQGEFAAIVGASGSGKSTLLHMLGGLDTPTSGRVLVEQKDLSRMSRDELTIFRPQKKSVFVFQNYNLLPLMNVYENIVLPIRLDGLQPHQEFVEEISGCTGSERKAKRHAKPALRRPAAAGGSGQGPGLHPAIVLLDEPTGNLDSATSQDVMGLIRVSAERFGQTLVMITPQ